MFRATVCPSSGEITVFMRHLIFVTMCGWRSGMQGGMLSPPCIPDSHLHRVALHPAYQTVIHTEWHSTLHTRQSSTHSDKYQVSHRYSCFSWWWAHSRPKHVKKRNKHSKKNWAPSWLYLQDYTRMHGQQNIKLHLRLSLPSWLFPSTSSTKALYVHYLPSHVTQYSPI